MQHFVFEILKEWRRCRKLVWFAGVFPVLCVDELSCVREISLVVRQVAAHLVYRPPLQFLIQCGASNADLLGDLRVRKLLLHKGLDLTALVWRQVLE